MLGSLVLEGIEQEIPLTKSNILIGRLPECDVVIPSSAVSGRHCRLVRQGEYWYLRDLNSTNGTRVNGSRCRQKKLLPNQRFSLPDMDFRLKYDRPKPEKKLSDDSLAMRALTSTSEAALDSVVTSGDDTFISENVPPPATTKPISFRRFVNLRIEPAEPRKAVRLKPLRKPTQLKRLAPQSKTITQTVTSHDESAESGIAALSSSAVVVLPKNNGKTKRYLGKLVPHAGGQPIPLLEPVLQVGRDRRCEVRIKCSKVSARHCSLTFEDGYWRMKDLQSSNGVMVNGERVASRIVMPGDKISFSRHHFTIQYEASGLPPRDPGLMSQTLLEKAGLQELLDGNTTPKWLAQHEDEERPRYCLTDSDPN